MIVERPMHVSCNINVQDLGDSDMQDSCHDPGMSHACILQHQCTRLGDCDMQDSCHDPGMSHAYNYLTNLD